MSRRSEWSGHEVEYRQRCQGPDATRAIPLGSVRPVDVRRLWSVVVRGFSLGALGNLKGIGVPTPPLAETPARMAGAHLDQRSERVS